jgi:digeranylgeranylglycerophospholipid reductase
METRIQGSTQSVTCSPSPGFIIDRVKFDRDLAREAAEKGVVVMCGTRLSHRSEEAWVLQCGSKVVEVRPAYVIAADGAASSVARILGEPPAEFLRGVQAEVPLKRSLDRTIVILAREYVAGYAWLFPKGNVANAGLGVSLESEVPPRSLLDGLIESFTKEGLIAPGRLALSGGLIPVSGIRNRLVMESVIFCGDAAGLTHPMSGAGIPQAVMSGRLAGTMAARTLKTSDSAHLDHYEREIRGWYGGVLGHALSKRTLMAKRRHDAEFEGLCESTWIGCKGYRRR